MENPLLTQNELSYLLHLLYENKATQENYLRLTYVFTNENVIQKTKFHQILQTYNVISYPTYQNNAKTVFADSLQQYYDFETHVLQQINCFALLNTLANEYCSTTNVNENTEQYIKDIITLIFETKEVNNINIPGNVIMALYIYDKINNMKDEQSKKTNSKKYLSLFINEKTISSKISVDLPLVDINSLKINELIQSIQNENDKNIFIFCIEFFDYILNETQNTIELQTFMNDINSILEKNSTYQLSLTLLICNKLNINYSLIDEKDKLTFFIWLIRLFIQYDMPIFELDKTILKDFGNLLNIDINLIIKQDSAFIFETLPLFFIKLANEIPKQKQYENISPYFNNFTKQILSDKDKPFSILLYCGIYYYKIINKEINQYHLSNILLTPNTKNTVNFDIYFYLMIMHSQLKEILKKKEQFTSIIQKFDERKMINPIEDLPKTNPDKLREFILKNDCNKINNLIGENLVYYDKLKLSVIPLKSKKTLLEYVSKLSPKCQAYVLCLELQNDDVLSIKEETLTDTHLCYYVDNVGDKQRMYYSFKGVFTFDKEKKKNIFIYDKRSQRWFSINQKQWISKCNFHKNESVVMIYFQKHEKTKEYNIDNGELQRNKFNNNKSEINLKLLIEFLKINVKLFSDKNKNKNKQLNRLYDLNSIENFEKIFKFVQNEDNLKTNLLLKQIIFDICNKNNTYKHLLVINPALPSGNNNSDTNIEFITNLHKYFLMDVNKFHNLLKTSLTEEFTETETFNKDFFFWNFKYYIMNINSLNVQNNLLVLYLTFVYFQYKLKSRNKNEQNFWKESFSKKNALLPFNDAKISSTFLSDFEKNQDINFKQIMLYWNTENLVMVDDFTWKYLSELMILHSESNNMNIKEQLIEFLTRNKQFMEFQNCEDKNIICYLKILYVFIKIKYERDKNKDLYPELLEICFNSTDKAIQLTTFQEIILDDYLQKYIMNYLFINDKLQEKSIPKIKDISLFIFDNRTLQEWFIKLLFILIHKEKYISFYKDNELQKLYNDLFMYSNNQKLQFAITVFILYCKVKKEKTKIKEISKIYGYKNYHYIFLSLQKNMKKEIQDKLKDKQLLSNEKNDETSLITQLNNIQSQLNKEWFALYEIDQDVVLKSKPLSQEQKPFIIYHMHKTKIDILKNIVNYHYWKYALKGLIILNDKSNSIETVLIKNKYNSYWYSLTNEWHKSHKGFIQKKNGNVIAIYTLITNKNKMNTFNFNEINFDENGKTIPVTDLKVGIKWLITKAYHIFVDNLQLFHNMFKLNEIFKIDILHLDETTKKELEKQLSLKQKAITLVQLDNAIN